MAQEENKGPELVPVGDWKPSSPSLAARGLRTLRGNQVVTDAGLHPVALASGVEMILVPGGPFIMGSDELSDDLNADLKLDLDDDSELDLHSDEKPMRTVTLSAYRLSKTPITVAQFQAYVQANNVKFDWEARKPSWGWQYDNPMVCVTWDEARAYCKWAGGDLPTEAQWERAARGTDGRKFPWGNEWDGNRCVHSDTEFGDRRNTVSVDRHNQTYTTDLGHTDMAGNVWEWCRDWWSSDGYRNLPDQDPVGVTDGDVRVLRGGCWFVNDPIFFRCASRVFSDPSSADVWYGFRIAGL
jgi:formylglycine-generating enzyme required for sulfatase activity